MGRFLKRQKIKLYSRWTWDWSPSKWFTISFKSPNIWWLLVVLILSMVIINLVDVWWPLILECTCMTHDWYWLINEWHSCFPLICVVQVIIARNKTFGEHVRYLKFLGLYYTLISPVFETFYSLSHLNHKWRANPLEKIDTFNNCTSLTEKIIF